MKPAIIKRNREIRKRFKELLVDDDHPWGKDFLQVYAELEEELQANGIWLSKGTIRTIVQQQGAYNEGKKKRK